MIVVKTNSNAASFPSVEVDYEDLFELRYWPDGRGADGWIDCIGIVLEVYRRAGLGLPDPALNGGELTAFLDLWEEIAAPSELYDLAALERSSWHVEVQVRHGLLLSATRDQNVFSRPLSRFIGHADAKYYRLRSEYIPA